MWKEIISDLMAEGLNQHEIAVLAGCTQTHISDLFNEKRGKRLGFAIGKRLQDLHHTRCKKKRKTPTREP